MLAEPKGLDPRTLELIHKVADGSADASEREEWDQLRTASPALATEFEAVQWVVGQLDALPVVEPPTDLKPLILGELRRREGARPPKFVPRPQAVSRWRRPALAWAAGLALIVGSAYFLDRNFGTGVTFVDPAEASATMGSRDLRAWRVVGTWEPREAGAGLNLVLRREGGCFAVEARSSRPGSSGPLEFRWDAKALECVAVEPAGENLEALNRSGAVRLGAPVPGGAGPLKPVVLFRLRTGIDKPQEVVLLAGGREYLRATIPSK